jgi:maleate isomerase
VLPCEPHVVAHGHSIHSFRGDGDRALAEEQRLEALCGIPFVTPSRAVLAGLEAIGRPRRIAILSPYWPPANEMIADFFAACGYQVVATHGLQSTGPTAVARFMPAQILAGFAAVDRPEAEALVHVGTNLAVSALTPHIEAHFGKPLVGVNVATYWLALRRIGILDPLPGMGRLAQL